MSFKTIVATGQQYVDGETVYGLTSKDNGKVWRICYSKGTLWRELKKTLYGKPVKVSVEGLARAQERLDKLAKAFGWKKLTQEANGNV